MMTSKRFVCSVGSRDPVLGHLMEYIARSTLLSEVPPVFVAYVEVLSALAAGPKGAQVRGSNLLSCTCNAPAPFFLSPSVPPEMSCPCITRFDGVCLLVPGDHGASQADRGKGVGGRRMETHVA